MRKILNQYEIEEYLLKVDNLFVPPLNTLVNIKYYSEKIARFSTQFCKIGNDGLIVGLVAMYCNDQDSKTAFITSVSVTYEYQGQGISKLLIKEALQFACDNGFYNVCLEVSSKNEKALALYESLGFCRLYKKNELIKMNKKI